MNILRHTSSLTGERTKKDPAFKGFRQSSSRLKQASPIAASLYKMMPKDVKEHALYRTLTGEAIKMLKEGVEAEVIIEVLKNKYINPLLEARENGKRTVKEPLTREVVKGIRDFTSYPQAASGIRKITRARRRLLLQKITEGQPADEHFPSTDSDPQSQSSRNISESPISEPETPEQPKRQTKTTSGLIFLGRLPECKKLKIWLRPVGSSSRVQ